MTPAASRRGLNAAGPITTPCVAGSYPKKISSRSGEVGCSFTTPFDFFFRLKWVLLWTLGGLPGAAIAFRYFKLDLSRRRTNAPNFDRAFLIAGGILSATALRSKNDFLNASTPVM